MRCVLELQAVVPQRKEERKRKDQARRQETPPAPLSTFQGAPPQLKLIHSQSPVKPVNGSMVLAFVPRLFADFRRMGQFELNVALRCIGSGVTAHFCPIGYPIECYKCHTKVRTGPTWLAYCTACNTQGRPYQAPFGVSLAVTITKVTPTRFRIHTKLTQRLFLTFMIYGFDLDEF